MELIDVLIVGTGPGGLSAAIQARARGLRYLVVDRAPHLADTVQRYQIGKLITNGPTGLPRRSGLPFTEASRETVLETWAREVAEADLNIKFNTTVTGLLKTNDVFEVEINDTDSIQASNVVLAIGVHGNLNLLNVPGGDWDGVQYELDDPALIENERIAVIGAGDSAIENAVSLADRNDVIVLNRQRDVVRATERNRSLLEKRIKEKRIEYIGEAHPITVSSGLLELQTPDGRTMVQCDRIIARLGAAPPRRFLESIGVKFSGTDAGALPLIDETYQTTINGLFLIGSVSGYPMIKHALNQGYEVVETICGEHAMPADEPLLLATLKPLLRDGSSSDAIARLKETVPLLGGLAPLQLRQFIHQVTVDVYEAGAPIFERGSYADDMYIVAEGSAAAVMGSGGSENSLPADEGFHYPAGAFFGELGVLGGGKRETTVRAGPDGVVVIKVPRHIIRRWLHIVPAIRKEFDRVSLMKILRIHLSSSLREDDLAPVVDAAEVIPFRPGEILFHEGDAPDGIHVIRKGSVTVAKQVDGREAILAYVPAGHYVGEMALISGDTRSATVRAAVETETVRIGLEPFNDLMNLNPGVRTEIERKILDRLEENEATHASELGVEMASFFTEQGIGEATDILLIDEQLCIHCDNCERACAETHSGTSRLDRRAGAMIAGLHVPTSCRHCENPLCMIDCPPDAIHRSANGEVFIDDTCIGCGNCENNCPFDVIRMASAEKSPASGFLDRLFGRERSPDLTDKSNQSDAVVAVKCDMCRELPGGPACVRSCPTGAALRIGPAEFFRITRERGLS